MTGFDFGGDGSGGPGSGNGDPPPPIPDNNVGTTNDDQFFWTPIDNPQVLDGLAGNDVMFASVGAGADTLSLFSVAAASGPAHADMTVNGVNAFDLVNVETINIRPLEGADTVTIGDFSTTNVGTVNLDLSAATFLPDGIADKVTVVAADAGSQISVAVGNGGNLLQMLDQANGALKAISVSNLDAIDQVTFQGGAGADTIAIGGGTIVPKIVVHGAGGNDSIVGGLGSETISGDAGNDTIHAAAGNGIVTGDAGNDVLINAQGVIANGGVGNDTLQGAFNDVLQGGDGDDVLTTGASTRANGEAGNDTITTGAGSNGALLAGGDGADSLSGDNNSVSFDGGAGNDFIAWSLNEGQSSHTVVNGGAEFDTLQVNSVQDNGSWQISLGSSGGFDDLRFVHTGPSQPGGPLVPLDTTLFITNTEHLVFAGGQVNDDIVIGDQSGTGVLQIDVDLGAVAGAADHFRDNLTLNATAGADNVVVALAQNGALVVLGLPEAVVVHDVDTVATATGLPDVILIKTGAGDDAINLTGLASANPQGSIQIDAGAGHNSIDVNTGDFLPGTPVAFTYRFTGASGAVDTIDGFVGHAQGGAGVIDVTSLGALTSDHSLGDLLNHHHIFDDGLGNVVITDGAGTSVTLAETAVRDLRAGDFLFG